MTINQIKTKWETMQNELMTSRGLEDQMTILFCRVIETLESNHRMAGTIPYTTEADLMVDELYKMCMEYREPEE